MSYLQSLRLKKGISERKFAQTLSIARETLRTYEQDPGQVRLDVLSDIAHALNRNLLVAIVPTEDCDVNSSTVSTSILIERDGFDSWKIHLMNLIDSFRESEDFRLIILPPTNTLDIRLQALMRAIVVSLCHETQHTPPPWALAELFLEKPWFVSGIEALKASAIVESPWAFRRNNIFVHSNFLDRA